MTLIMVVMAVTFLLLFFAYPWRCRIRTSGFPILHMFRSPVPTIISSVPHTDVIPVTCCRPLFRDLGILLAEIGTQRS